MKNHLIYLLAFALAIACFPMESNATGAPYENKTMADSAARQLILVNRLEQIQQTDRSNLSYAEKTELRKEERAIKEALSSDGYGGIYISVGVLLVIIIILLIILI